MFKDPENYFFLVVKGDSMEPRISDGDLALVHRRTHWTTAISAFWSTGQTARAR